MHRKLLIAALLMGGTALANERQGSTVKAPDTDSALNPKNLTETLRTLKPMNVLRVNSVVPANEFDIRNFRADTSHITDLCFTSVGSFVPFGERDAMAEVERKMTCEERESIVKALGLASVFMKGTSYTCAFVPLPQAQLAAKIIDVASYATSSVALVVSVTSCENTNEAKFNALIKACENLNTMGVNCLGVDNEPF